MLSAIQRGDLDLGSSHAASGKSLPERLISPTARALISQTCTQQGLVRSRPGPRAASGPTRLAPVASVPPLAHRVTADANSAGPEPRRAAAGSLRGADVESVRLFLVQRAVYDLDQQPNILSVCRTLHSAKARAAVVFAARLAWFLLLRSTWRSQTPSF